MTGTGGWGCLVHPLLPVSGTGTGFDSSPIKGEGYEVGVVLFALWMLDQVQYDSPALWIDESLMNLYEILGFQPKGVATLIVLVP